eukprot:m.128371 g.128371  ORF g.128371 m.128371 type:complete len:1167 (-) comp9749_c0_seq1:224-3724(-)
MSRRRGPTLCITASISDDDDNSRTDLASEGDADGRGNLTLAQLASPSSLSPAAADSPSLITPLVRAQERELQALAARVRKRATAAGLTACGQPPSPPPSDASSSSSSSPSESTIALSTVSISSTATELVQENARLLDRLRRLEISQNDAAARNASLWSQLQDQTATAEEFRQHISDLEHEIKLLREPSAYKKEPSVNSELYGLVCQQISAKDKELAQLKQELNGRKQTIRDLRSSLSKLKAEQGEKRAHDEQVEQLYHKAMHQLARVEAENSDLKNSIIALDNKSKDQAKRLSQQNRKRDADHAKALQAQKRRVEQLERQLQAANAAKASESRKPAIRDSSASVIDNLRRRVTQQNNEIKALKADQAELVPRSEIHELQNRLQEAVLAQSTAERELQAALASLHQQRLQFEGVERSLEERAQRIQQLEAQLAVQSTEAQKSPSSPRCEQLQQLLDYAEFATAAAEERTAQLEATVVAQEAEIRRLEALLESAETLAAMAEETAAAKSAAAPKPLPSESVRDEELEALRADNSALQALANELRAQNAELADEKAAFLDELNEVMDNMAATKARLESQVHSLEVELAAARNDSQDSQDSTCSACAATVAECEHRIQQIELECDQRIQRERETMSESQRSEPCELCAQHARLEKRRGSTLEAARQELKDLRSELARIREAQASFRNQMAMPKLTAQVQQLFSSWTTTQQSQVEAVQAPAERRCAALEREKHELQAQATRAEAALAETEARLEALKTSSEEQLRRLRLQAVQGNTRLDEYFLEKQSLELAASSLREELQNMRHRNTQLRTEVSAARDAQRRAETANEDLQVVVERQQVDIQRLRARELQAPLDQQRNDLDAMRTETAKELQLMREHSQTKLLLDEREEQLRSEKTRMAALQAQMECSRQQSARALAEQSARLRDQELEAQSLRDTIQRLERAVATARATAPPALPLAPPPLTSAATSSDAEAKLQRRIAKLEAEIGRLRSTESQLRGELEASQSEIKRLSGVERDASAQLARDHRRLREELASLEEEYERKLRTARRAQSDAELRVETLSKKLKHETALCDQMRRGLSEIDTLFQRDQRNRQSSEVALRDEHQRQLAEVQRTVDALKHSLRLAEDNLQQQLDANAQLCDERESHIQQIRDLRETLHETTLRLRQELSAAC